VKKTRAKRLSDTVFFKHHYIPQPTVTPADAIVNAYNKLQQTSQGIQHSKEDAQMEALERIEQSLQPTSNEHNTSPRVEAELTQQVPRVRFDEAVPKVQEPEPRLVVAWPKKQIVQPPVPNVTKERPKPILKPSKYIDESSESVASRVKVRRLQTVETPQQESIADRVARRRREREAVHSVLDQETGQLLEYRTLLKHPRFKEVWNRSPADEFGRLAQGIGGRVKGTDTIRFIHKHQIPQDRFKDVTYIKFVCTIRTKKKDPYRTRATMGGNLINYTEDVGTPTANLLLIKIFLNSVILTNGARFANADIANFYLMTPLKQSEYAKIRLSDIPEEVIKEYNLHEKATADGWIYIEVVRGMYGLPQAGSLGHDLLEERLNNRKVTSRAKSYQGSGSTKQDQYNLYWSSMTSESSSSSKPILTTSLHRLRSTMMSPSTSKEKNTSKLS
jgi:hypothetical protein